MEKFADYGFNKSHAAAYALVSYQTAWLKANHPVAFLAASMTLDLDNTDKLAGAHAGGVAARHPVLPPDINRSGAEFLVETHDGRQGGDPLRPRRGQARRRRRRCGTWCAARDAGGPFASLADFAARVDPKLLNKMQIENLAKAGAFDSLEQNRARLVAGAETILRRAQASAEDRASAPDRPVRRRRRDSPSRCACPTCRTGRSSRSWRIEAEAVGFHLSAHPLDTYQGAAEAARRDALRADRRPGAGRLGAAEAGRHGGATKERTTQAPAAAWPGSASPTPGRQLRGDLLLRGADPRRASCWRRARPCWSPPRRGWRARRCA